MPCLTLSNVVQGAGVHAARHGGDTVARRAQVSGRALSTPTPTWVRAGEPSADESTMVMWSMQWMTTVLQDPVGTCGAGGSSCRWWSSVGRRWWVMQKKCYTEDFFRGLTFQRNFEQISLKLVPADESLKFGGSC